MFYFRPLNLGASCLLKFCDITIKLIRKSACLYFLFLLSTYVYALFLPMLVRGKRTIKKNENWKPQHLRNQTGWCLRCPRDVCRSPNDVLRGVESPHFSSILPVPFSICITSVCVHYHLIKLQSYWQTQARQPLSFFPLSHVAKVVVSMVYSQTGPSFQALQQWAAVLQKHGGKKWQERQEVAVCVCLDLCLSAVSVFFDSKAEACNQKWWVSRRQRQEQHKQIRRLELKSVCVWVVWMKMFSLSPKVSFSKCQRSPLIGLIDRAGLKQMS